MHLRHYFLLTHSFRTRPLRIFSVFILAILMSWLSPSLSSASTLFLHQQPTYYDYLQPSFSDYVQISKRWLLENRHFVGDNKHAEVEMNAPFEKHPVSPSSKAILLVHGLDESAYSFSDISDSLVAQGFHVYSLLLPGHGSKPEDMMLPSYQDWQDIVDYYTEQLSNEHPDLWLGGFSTGGNLVTITASKRTDIRGLLLISPGFRSKTAYLEQLSPLIAKVKDWGWKRPENNMVRYSSSTLNGASAYTKSARVLRETLKETTINIPTLLALSEADSVLDVKSIRTLFNEHFKHPSNQLIWYGQTPTNSPPTSTPNVTAYSMRLPDLRISTASHMSILYKDTNPYYGRLGGYRICYNSLSKKKQKRCELKKEPLWFSAWGYSEKNRVYARLTWNPYYKELEQHMKELLNAAKASANTVETQNRN